MVAAATGSLCEAANAAVQGNASEEKLIASAKAVANSTAQLLLACRVKADPTSVTQKRLQVKEMLDSYWISVTLKSSFIICFIIINFLRICLLSPTVFVSSSLENSIFSSQLCLVPTNECSHSFWEP